MSEGTRIGEFKESIDFNAAVKQESEVVSTDTELRATKIGEMSEFEKSLYPTESGDKKSDAFADAIAMSVADYQAGDIIKGIVRSVEKSGLLVDIGYKADGFVSNAEFSNDPEASSSSVKSGDEIYVYILKLETKEGYTVLSKKRADYELAWNTLSKLSKTKDVIDVRIVSKVEGGLVSDYNGIRGFIPASQVLHDPSESLDHFVGSFLTVTVIQVDRKRRKVVFSHKQAKSKPNREEVLKLLDSIEVGQVREGKVTSIKDFGAFVDLGGAEGLVHISEMSWSRIGHPTELLKTGDDIKVFILGIDRENCKISLGLKQLESDPWVTVADRYAVGQVVDGTVTRVATFGAFVKLEDHIEGLIHISELSHSRVNQVDDVVKAGQVVKAQVIKVLPSEQRIGLSIKALEAKPEAPSAQAEATSESE
ncbi:MAG: 30S ribosomal protein S1 [Candidatus Margulisiibacteriota bacterium]